VAPSVHAAAVIKRIERALHATGLPDGKGQKGTALESALYTVREGYSRFYEPLDDVADTVEVACTKSPHLIAALAEASTGWTSTALNAFLLIAGYTGSWNLRHQYGAQAWDPKVKRQAEVFQARLRELFAALPASTDRTVSQRLVQWGLRKAHTSKLPKVLPTNLKGALALYAEFGLTSQELALGKPASSVHARLPAALKAFYARHDRLGSRAIAPPSKLAGLGAELARQARAHLREDEGEVDPGAIHLAALSPIEKLYPFGKNASGDLFFLDPSFKHEGEPVVLRFHHDMTMTCTVEASSLGAFVAAQIVDTAFGRGLLANEVRRLIARDRKRVRVPRALSRAPHC
jgi:hypothetical protein